LRPGTDRRDPARTAARRDGAGWASWRVCRYHRRVQEIELALIGAGALAILVVAMLRHRATFARHPLALGAVVGAVPGIIGAVVVLVPRTDLVPDAAEPFLWLAIGLVASGIAIVALTVGVARH
jgi:hypothetical protein